MSTTTTHQIDPMNEQNMQRQDKSGSMLESITSAMTELINNHELYAEYDIDLRNLDMQSLAGMKSMFHHIVEIANQYNIKINFHNMIRREIKRCCIWFSGHKWNAFDDLQQMATAMSSSTRNNKAASFAFNVLRH